MHACMHIRLLLLLHLLLHLLFLLDSFYYCLSRPALHQAFLPSSSTSTRLPSSRSFALLLRFPSFGSFLPPPLLSLSLLPTFAALSYSREHAESPSVFCGHDAPPLSARGSLGYRSALHRVYFRYLCTKPAGKADERFRARNRPAELRDSAFRTWNVFRGRYL